MTELFPDVIETERLRLERLCRTNVDVFEYYRVCSSDPGIEEVTEYLLWSSHDSPDVSVEFLERCEKNWENREGVDYLVRPKEPHPDVRPRAVPDDEYGPFAGQTGLHLDWDRQLGTLGLWLRKAFWGRRYSGERAAALFALAFDRLDLDVVSVSHDPGNDKSRPAIEKYVDRFGGRKEGRLRNFHEDDDGPVDQVRYSVSQEEFRENRPEDLGVTFS
ncbi:GNAT family N-acetyltransferase [Halobacteriales archaeon QS_1_68_20]|nr:MAG: GNAT family N-acetyltransferase [Halobacteriales archaeon QS_1_68_20]